MSWRIDARAAGLALVAGCAALAPATITPAAGQGLVVRHSLGAEAAKAAVAACEAFARKNGWAMTISVLDAEGEPLAFLRMDGTPLVTLDFANGKAKAAQRMGAPSTMLLDRLGKGETQVLSWGLLPSKGGLPIIVNGETVGAVGTSGNAGGRDVECTQAAVDAAQKVIAASAR